MFEKIYTERLYELAAKINGHNVQVQGARDWQENIILFIEYAVSNELARLDQAEESEPVEY